MRWGRRLAQQLGGASFKTPDPPRGREKISLLDYDPKLRRRDVDYVSSDPGHVPHSRFPWKLVIAVLAFIGLCLVCAIRGGGFSISGPSAFFALSSTNYGSTVSTSNVQGNNDLDGPNDLDGSNELADGPNGDRLFGGTNTTSAQDLPNFLASFFSKVRGDIERRERELKDDQLPEAHANLMTVRAWRSYREMVIEEDKRFLNLASRPDGVLDAVTHFEKRQVNNDAVSTSNVQVNNDAVPTSNVQGNNDAVPTSNVQVNNDAVSMPDVQVNNDDVSQSNVQGNSTLLFYAPTYAPTSAPTSAPTCWWKRDADVNVAIFDHERQCYIIDAVPFVSFPMWVFDNRESDMCPLCLHKWGVGYDGCFLPRSAVEAVARVYGPQSSQDDLIGSHFEIFERNRGECIDDAVAKWMMRDCKAGVEAALGDTTRGTKNLFAHVFLVNSNIAGADFHLGAWAVPEIFSRLLYDGMSCRTSLHEKIRWDEYIGPPGQCSMGDMSIVDDVMRGWRVEAKYTSDTSGERADLLCGDGREAWKYDIIRTQTADHDGTYSQAVIDASTGLTDPEFYVHNSNCVNEAIADKTLFNGGYEITDDYSHLPPETLWSILPKLADNGKHPPHAYSCEYIHGLHALNPHRFAFHYRGDVYYLRCTASKICGYSKATFARSDQHDISPLIRMAANPESQCAYKVRKAEVPATVRAVASPNMKNTMKELTLAANGVSRQSFVECLVAGVGSLENSGGYIPGSPISEIKQHAFAYFDGMNWPAPISFGCVVCGHRSFEFGMYIDAGKKEDNIRNIPYLATAAFVPVLRRELLVETYRDQYISFHTKVKEHICAVVPTDPKEWPGGSVAVYNENGFVTFQPGHGHQPQDRRELSHKALPSKYSAIPAHNTLRAHVVKAIVLGKPIPHREVSCHSSWSDIKCDMVKRMALHIEKTAGYCSDVMAKHLPRVVRAYDKRMQEFVEKRKRKPFVRSSSRP